MKILELKAAEVNILLEIFSSLKRRLILNDRQRKVPELGMTLNNEDRRHFDEMVQTIG